MRKVVNGVGFSVCVDWDECSDDTESCGSRWD